MDGGRVYGAAAADDDDDEKEEEEKEETYDDDEVKVLGEEKTGDECDVSKNWLVYFVTCYLVLIVLRSVYGNTHFSALPHAAESS